MDCADKDKLDQQLFEILANYLEAAETGVPPDEAGLLTEHPEFAAELKEFLAIQRSLEKLTARARSAMQTVRIMPADSDEAEDPGSALSTRDVSSHASSADQSRSRAVRRYQYRGEVARGGMGVIIKARDTLLERDVAFKFLRAIHLQDAAMRWRFAREARITASLQHPGIVAVYDIGNLPGARPCFTMSFVKGQTLTRLLDERPERVRELPHFLKIFEQICQAVGYAHTEGVIHRDLKPDNVMVSPFGVVQVMDWGLAKVVRREAVGKGHSEATSAEAEAALAEGSEECRIFAEIGCESRAGQAIGTPAYMAPEQARGNTENLNERVDVFGLGAILCVILTGNPPYTGSSEEVLNKAIGGELGDALARLDECRADPQLIELAKQCLAVEPGDRFRDAAEVSAAVTAYLEANLQRAERDLVRFFDLSLDLFCVAGLDGFFRRVNVNFSRVLGYTENELRSRPFLEFVHPDDHKNTTGAMEILLRGQPVIRFINRYRNSQGAYRRFEWTAKSIPEERVIFAVARDVTERIEQQVE
jgi:serine/threonine-protein kinase